MNTKLSQKTISKVSATNILIHIAEILVLISIGMIGVLLHAKFRTPLRLPGHHGLIYMALIVGGRILSKKPYASSLSSVGAAMMLMFPLGFKDPLMPLIYLVPGMIVDFSYRLMGQKKKYILVLGVICGLSYMTIPLSRIMISTISGIPYGSLLTGFLWPLLTHFFFGFAGGLAGTALVRLFNRLMRKQ